MKKKIFLFFLSILGVSLLLLESPASALEIPDLYFKDGESLTFKFRENSSYYLQAKTTSTSKITYAITSGSENIDFLSESSIILKKIGTATIKACVAETETFEQKCVTQTITINPGSRTVIVGDKEAIINSGQTNLYKIEGKEIPESTAKDLKIGDKLDENLEKVDDENSIKYQIASIETSVDNSDRLGEKYVGYGGNCVIRGNYCERDAYNYQKIYRTVVTTTIFRIKNLTDSEPNSKETPPDSTPNPEETPSDFEPNSEIIPFIPDENIPDSFGVLPKLVTPGTGVLTELSENSIEFYPDFNVLVLNFFLFSITSLRILYKNRL